MPLDIWLPLQAMRFFPISNRTFAFLYAVYSRDLFRTFRFGHVLSEIFVMLIPHRYAFSQDHFWLAARCLARRQILLEDYFVIKLSTSHAACTLPLIVLFRSTRYCFMLNLFLLAPVMAVASCGLTLFSALTSSSTHWIMAYPSHHPPALCKLHALPLGGVHTADLYLSGHY